MSGSRSRDVLTCQLAALQGLGNSVLVADRTTSGVDEPSTLLEVLEEVSVHEAAGTFVQWAVDGDNIALGDEILEILDTTSVDCLCGLCNSNN